MRLTRLAVGLAGALLSMNPGPSSADAPPGLPPYPDAPRDGTVDDYHGTPVPDPYRPLEDLDAPATRAWIEAENQLTDAYLEAIPARESIRKRLTTLWDYEKFGLPSKEGDRYFFSRNSGLQNQSVLYTAAELDADPKVLLDPNQLADDGTIALTGLAVTDDGTKVAYALSASGSDWKEWKVRDVETGEDLGDLVRWSKFSGASWTKDGRGFYYGRFPEPAPGEDLKGTNYYNKLYYHRLGTPQADDTLVYQRTDQREWEFQGHVTDDGAYLIITVSKGTDNKYRILYKPLEDEPEQPIELIGNFDHEFSFIDNDGPVFYFQTDADAPRRRLIAIDTRQPDPEHWVELIPQAEETLLGVDLVGGMFIANYLKDARTQVKVFDRDGQFVREVEFPEIGTASGFSGKKTDRETFYSFSSYTRPRTIYRYDVESGQSHVYQRPEVAFNPDDYETRQVFYTSKDGTRIPMFLSHKKGLTPGPDTPTLLYGYGGFNIPLTPGFNPVNLVWMERGGVYAVANLRGGGEYGEEWHQAGARANKQNVFDDFIAAAEFLIENRMTSTPKLAIEGRSNGGLLVGACLTQRPDLYGATLPGVGVMDMLRFHKFTIGWAWVDDYGSSDDPDQFKTLRAYSPLHNIRPATCYPPTLVTTADHDDRVFPAHSFKFAAALQAAQSCDNPVMIRIETKAGHGADKPTAKIIEDAADKLAFLIHELGVEAP